MRIVFCSHDRRNFHLNGKLPAPLKTCIDGATKEAIWVASHAWIQHHDIADIDEIIRLIFVRDSNGRAVVTAGIEKAIAGSTYGRFET